MADETHKLQKDPPEGSRKVIDHELQRQAEAGKDGAHKRDSAETGKSDGADEAGRGGSR
jgi:hypothetical protein